MEKLFGVDVDSEEESNVKKDISDDKNKYDNECSQSKTFN